MIVTYASNCCATWTKEKHMHVVLDVFWLFTFQLTDCVWFVPGTMDDDDA